VTAVAANLAEIVAGARKQDEEGRPAEALDLAWQALDLARGEADSKQLVVDLLSRHSSLAQPERSADLAGLVADPTIDPMLVAPAAWQTLLAEGAILAGPDDPEALARALEAGGLAERLLLETHVTILGAELALTRLRRWMLLSGRWADFPRLVAALAVQARHNGGAWPFGEDEKARLESNPEAPIAAAYLPSRPALPGDSAFADPVTSRVARRYRAWPYPPWSRLTPPPPTTIPELMAKLDGGGPCELSVDAEILVAGCGTGREAAITALRFPHSNVTAIDISEASLAYAEARCRSLGLDRIDFRLLDLHRAGELGRKFDFITSSGVLHHLPDPEAGWEKLAAVLKPGGGMHVMVYSKVGRLKVRAAQSLIADLRGREVDDDLLREVRRRLIERAPKLMLGSSDYFTLAGIHDLLLHPREDPFDVPRIARSLDSLGLELLAFELPTPHARASYRSEHPDDPLFRDVAAWASLEKTQPFLFSGMYKFWCRKRAPAKLQPG
jgi:SAM-dependent methyltransferase